MDGKTTFCPNCGSENPENASYCMFCGSALAKANVCPHCKTENPKEARFCYVCGTSLSAAPAPAYTAEPVCTVEPVYTSESARGEVKTARQKGVRFYLSLAGGICAIVAAALALIFTFLIGVGFSAPEIAESTASLGVRDGFFYTYFSQAYRDIAEVLSSAGGDAEFIALSLYLPAVLGTLVTAAALVGVPILVIVASVRFANALRNKGRNNYLAPAIAAVALYIGAACAILMLNNFSATGSAGSTSTSSSSGLQSSLVPAASLTLGTVFNTPTVAGIVLSAVFLLAGCGLRFAAALLAPKETRPPLVKTMLTAAFAVVGFVLAAVVLSMSVRGAIEVTNEGNSISFMQSVLMMTAGIFYKTNADVAAPTVATVTYILSTIGQLGAIACAAMLLARFSRNASGKHASPLRFAIPMFVFTVLYLASTIAFCDAFFAYTTQLQSAAEAIPFAYTAPIAVTVISALLLALSIADTAVCSKKKK